MNLLSSLNGLKQTILQNITPLISGTTALAQLELHMSKVAQIIVGSMEMKLTNWT